MAEEDSGQERTEDPTPKRRKDAKEKGQIARSRELSTTLLMLGSAAGLFVFGDYMGQGITALIDTNFRINRADIFDPGAPVRLLQQAIGQGLLIITPFALLMVLVTMVASVALGGWSFNLKGAMPKLEKLDPIKGLGRMFSAKALVELLKSVIKVCVVGGVGVLVTWLFRDDFLALTRESLETGIAHGISLFFWSFFLLAVSLILIAAVDVPFQIYEVMKKLRMTKQEVKDEYKESEGKPEVKSRIRQLQRELSRGRMLEKVPTADVIVTNPTHFAVALKYDQLNMRAPKVVAMGTDLVAARIRELALENRVPIFEAPPLARALYYTSQLDKEIPGGLYLAVAQVLAYIYQLRSVGAGVKPPQPRPEIPDEFKKYANKGL